MTTMTEDATTTQVHRIYIRASAERIWEAITRPEWTERYGYRVHAEYDLRRGGRYRALTSAEWRAQAAAHGITGCEVIAEGDILEATPPSRLVMTFHFTLPPEAAAEPPTRLTYEIEPQPDGTCKLTVTHELEGAPTVARIVSGKGGPAGGGTPWILSDLKTLLETGRAFAEQ